MANSGYSHAEVKAGLFLTFSLAILVAMLFIYGKASRMWRGREELNVVFKSVTSLRPDAPVRFNGVEVGRVKSINIISLDEKNRARLPRIRPQDLDNLPLTDAHRAELRRFKPLPPNADEAARAKWDEEYQAAVLQYVADRNMIELTLEVLSPQEKEAVRRYRADDQIRITTTLLGDTSVEVSSGSSQDAPPLDKLILGISDEISEIGEIEKVAAVTELVDKVCGLAE